MPVTPPETACGHADQLTNNCLTAFTTRSIRNVIELLRAIVTLSTVEELAPLSRLGCVSWQANPQFAETAGWCAVAVIRLLMSVWVAPIAIDGESSSTR